MSLMTHKAHLKITSGHGKTLPRTEETYNPGAIMTGVGSVMRCNEPASRSGLVFSSAKGTGMLLGL